MQIFIWLFRLILIPFGLSCIFVSLDMLYIWGVEAKKSHRSYIPKPTDRRVGSYRSKFLTHRKKGFRPSPDTWIWWDGRMRRPAFYLLFLGVAMTFVSVLTMLPGYGNYPWISDRFPGVALVLFGLTLLRGTLKISSPILWKKITIIKRPLSGKARPSLFWMGTGLVIIIIGLYGLVCNFTLFDQCVGENSDAVWMIFFTIGEFIMGGMAAIGLEEMLQSWQEGEALEPRALVLFGLGLVLFVAILFGRVILV